MKPLSIKQPRILFFTAGPVATQDEIYQASQINGTICFRNSGAVPNEMHSLEVCDGVAGKVPRVYALKWPSADEATAEHNAALAAMRERVGDDKPPVIAAAKTEETPKTVTDKAVSDKPAWTPNKK